MLMVHRAMQIAGVICIALIWIVSWNQSDQRLQLDNALLGSAFLALGLLEFAHTLLSSPNEYNALGNINNLLVIAGQYCAALGLASVAVAPERRISKTAFVTLHLLALFVALIILALQQHLHTPDIPFVSVMILSQIVLAALLAGVGAILWRRGLLKKQAATLHIATASFLLALSALSYQQHLVLDNWSSALVHCLVLTAYLLLFYALVITNIRQPYETIARLKQHAESTLRALPDLTFETSEDGIILHYHASPDRQDLLVPPSQFLGKRVDEILPDNVLSAWQSSLDACRLYGQSYGVPYSLSLATGERHYEISASRIDGASRQASYLFIARDVTESHALNQRLEGLLKLAEDSAGQDVEALARFGLDTLETLTGSHISFLHFLTGNEENVELFAWSTATLAHYCHATERGHYPVSLAGLWADSVRTRLPVIVNDYANAPNKRGLPEGHSALTRVLTVPVLEEGRIVMLIGIGNADYDYNQDTVKTVELYANDLYQMLQRRRSQRESEQSRQLMQQALVNLPVGVAISRIAEDDLHFEYFNDKFHRIYDIDPAAITNLTSFAEAAFPEAEFRHQILGSMEQDFARGDSLNFRWDRIPVERAGKPVRYVNVQLKRIPDTPLAVSIVEDVTEEVVSEAELRIASTAFASQEAILIADANRRILRVNKAFESSMGYSAQEAIGRTPAFLQSGVQHRDFYQTLWQVVHESGIWRGEIWNRVKDGSIVPFSLTISAVKNDAGAITHYVGDYINLSNIKDAEDTINRLSLFDPLTGLINRHYLKTLLSEQQLRNLSRTHFAGGLIFDLDNFKIINDTQGHDAGDALILETAKRIGSHMNPEDKVARTGGDEFIALIMNLGDSLEQASIKLELIGKSLLAHLEDTYRIGSSDYFSSCSIGATLLPVDVVDAREVLKQLDIALTYAKEAGPGQFRFFDPQLQATVNDESRLLDALRVAIRDGQLELFFQPQFNEEDTIVGAEGLIRWHHPVRGLLTPDEFLPLAQEHHLMKRLGDEVLRMGVYQLNQWQTQGLPELTLSLNITADQFYEERFESNLHALLVQFPVKPGTLMLEFTESVLVSKLDVVTQKIMRLNDLEVKFAIDDFGTGYSSLSYLSSLPMDQLKIDQSFVQNIGIVESDSMIVRTIITMARELNMEVLAEGVETTAQRDFLSHLGCHLFQGYLYSKPLPVNDFDALIDAQSPQTP